MLCQNKRITYKTIYMISLFILLVSRILVLTGNYNWPVNPIALEILYLFLTVFLVIGAREGRLIARKGKPWLVLAILLIHTVLWGLVFINKSFEALIFSYFKSQMMFMLVVVITVWAIQCFDAEKSFVKCGYYALSTVLIVQLITHFSELDLSNLANIMTATERTRANFGFGHFNTLGACCACNILFYDSLKKTRSKKQRIADVLIVVVSLVMLLSSASRSAITSLVLYFLVRGFLSMDVWPLSKRVIASIKVISVAFIVAMIVFTLFNNDVSEVLALTQRVHIFTHTIPLFLKSGRVWLGLGYASNHAYGTWQTPYSTYWMDNGYIYTMVTTGIVGIAVFVIALVMIAKALYRNRITPSGKQMIAVFCVYLYISLFEAVLFSSAGLTNYFYIPWLLLGMTPKGQEHVKSVDAEIKPVAPTCIKACR